MIDTSKLLSIIYKHDATGNAFDKEHSEALIEIYKLIGVEKSQGSVEVPIVVSFGNNGKVKSAQERVLANTAYDLSFSRTILEKGKELADVAALAHLLALNNTSGYLPIFLEERDNNPYIVVENTHATCAYMTVHIPVDRDYPWIAALIIAEALAILKTTLTKANSTDNNLFPIEYDLD